MSSADPHTTEPWASGVVARYLTVAGATVDITEETTEPRPSTPPDNPAHLTYYRPYQVIDITYTSRCGGCNDKTRHTYEVVGALSRPGFLDDITYSGPRQWAQTHAETCRALPRPDGAA
ncbi:hypothetical protein [Streptacidiphilus sp. EB129]|uniref:hypothetical protein n=1 Tax=Streptacidiphilus sp. EB129 TaxID=3156262 RepID=UPI003516CC3C